MNHTCTILALLMLTFAGESQWNIQNSGSSSNLRSVFFLNSLTGFVGGSTGVILKTTNGGLNWSPLSSGLSVEINSIYFTGSNTGFACANGGNLIMTTNSGVNWSPVTSGVTDNLYAISFSGSANGVCSGSGGTLLYTSNGGFNWVIAANGFISSYYGIFMVSSTAAFAGGVNTIFQPLFARTTNSGANWTYSAFYLNSNEGNLRDLHFFSTSDGIAVSNVWDGRGGISSTSNGGVNWTTQFHTVALNSVDFAGQNIGYAVGINGNIIKTNNGGTNWVLQTSGVSANLRSVDFLDSLTGYACGDGGVILKTTNGGITGIANISNEIPGEFGLYQNYPNPFNPSTKIRVSVPYTKSDFLYNIKIYNEIGIEITTLYSGSLRPGVYELTWDALEHPSGVYFCRLSTQEYTKSIRMSLLK
jgi:photosystem II stability/assembly factor-like uncharacterized protein